jgi:hypothetical protein
MDSVIHGAKKSRSINRCGSNNATCGTVTADSFSDFAPTASTAIPSI